MLKLKKYLKPFLLSLLFAVILLFVQAMCDLNLPNLMSNIVNIGIQQSGIEHAAPEAISENGMKLMRVFMTEDEKNLVDQSYNLVPAGDVNDAGKTYDSLYPNASGGSLYVLTEGSDGLDNAFGTATWTMINVMRDMAAQSGQETAVQDAMNVEEVDFTRLYAMLPMLEQLPPQVIQSARDNASNMDETMLVQSGVVLTSNFYKELGADVGAIQSGYILRIGTIMILVTLLGGVATVMVSFISSRMAAGIARNLRRDIFRKVESFSNGEFDKFSTASLITRNTNDVTQIQMFIGMGIRMLCYAPIMGVGGIIMALRKSTSMSWIIGLACGILLVVIVTVFRIALPKFKIIQKLVDRLNLVSRENLNGLMVIRAFGTQEHEKGRFEKANTDLTKVNLFVNRVMVFMMPVMILIMNGISLLVIWTGAHQIANSAMQVGDMMAFVQYAMQVIMSFLMISMMFIFVPRASVSGDRIAEVLSTEPAIADPKNPKTYSSGKKGLVEFKNVNFRYFGAEEDALHDVSFTARPGQTTAIIGSTGSGKSTIANLLMRFYDITGGKILVDGLDVREVTQKDLHDRIGYVPQQGVLFSGTIDSNLRYGDKNASGEDIEKAAQVAQAMEFIEEKPEKFQSEISQGGTNVSGGQKQRLSIARALVKKPDIFIFDDSFSALDFKTDGAVRKALAGHTAHSAVIIVAQRVSTIMNAHQIIVLEKGRIVGQGTHKELLKSCEEYYEIASSQLSKEELA